MKSMLFVQTVVVLLAALSAGAAVNVRDFGAKGDGKNLAIRLFGAGRQ